MSEDQVKSSSCHRRDKTSDQEEIEVGVAGGELRLWLAKEAVRHGEILLLAQQNNLVAMEARAGSILGWSVPIIIGLGATVHGSFKWSALGAVACLAPAAISCAVALWPQNWGHVGYDPKMLLEERLESELTVLESIAMGYARTAELNTSRLVRFGRWLKVAWVSFLFAPLAAALVLVHTAGF